MTCSPWPWKAPASVSVHAKDGNTAARIATVARPAGIITDVRMPALNGMELCRLVRSHPDLRHTLC